MEQGEQEATAARTHIKDGLAIVKVAQDFLDKGLAVLPRDQDSWGDRESQSHKFLFAEDVLQGDTLLALGNAVYIMPMLLCGDFSFAVGQQVVTARAADRL
jgi:hypothetical protein